MDRMLAESVFVGESEEEEKEKTSNAPKRKTANCGVRLMNIFFSDKYAEDFGNSGNTIDRGSMDKGHVGYKTPFWTQVTKEFQTNEHDFNQRVTDDSRYSALDPSKKLNHDASKLNKIWKSINAAYRKALGNFTQSGTHDPNFYNFCGGNLETAYLYDWLQFKHNLTDFVGCGMLEEDKFDSMNPIPSKMKIKRKRSVSVDTSDSDGNLGKLTNALLSSLESQSKKRSKEDCSRMDLIEKLEKKVKVIKEQIVDCYKSDEEEQLNVQLKKYQQKLKEEEEAFF